MPPDATDASPQPLTYDPADLDSWPIDLLRQIAGDVGTIMPNLSFSDVEAAAWKETVKAYVAAKDAISSPAAALFIGAPSTTLPTDLRTDLATTIADQFKQQLGDAWDSRFSAEHRDLLEAITLDAADVLMLNLVTTDKTVIARARKNIEAQLANVAGYEQSNLVAKFWAAVYATLKTSLKWLLVAARV